MGTWGCVHLLAVVNRAAVNLGAHISLKTPLPILAGIYPAVGLLDRMVVPF